MKFALTCTYPDIRAAATRTRAFRFTATKLSKSCFIKLGRVDLLEIIVVICHAPTPSDVSRGDTCDDINLGKDKLPYFFYDNDTE